MQISQPMQRSSIIVCDIFGAPTIASNGHTFRQIAQPTQYSSCIKARLLFGLICKVNFIYLAFLVAHRCLLSVKIFLHLQCQQLAACLLRFQISFFLVLNLPLQLYVSQSDLSVGRIFYASEYFSHILTHVNCQAH